MVIESPSQCPVKVLSRVEQIRCSKRTLLAPLSKLTHNALCTKLKLVQNVKRRSLRIFHNFTSNEKDSLNFIQQDLLIKCKRLTHLLTRHRRGTNFCPLLPPVKDTATKPVFASHCLDTSSDMQQEKPVSPIEVHLKNCSQSNLSSHLRLGDCEVHSHPAPASGPGGERQHWHHLVHPQ